MNAQFKDISKEAFIIAYKENFGNITIACEAAGVGRGMYKSWCDKDTEFRTRLAEIEPEEIMLDFGEHKLMERISKGDTLATMFLLKTKGKRRGYIERQEVAHEGDVVKQITVNVLKPGARLAVISFHSLEDRIVKQFLQANAKIEIPRGLPVREKDLPKSALEIISRVKPSAAEILENPRARSAIMRIAEKRAGVSA